MKVKNISETLRILYDKGGKRIELKPGESVEMINPPKENYAFEISESNTEKKGKAEELKTIRRSK